MAIFLGYFTKKTLHVLSRDKLSVDNKGLSLVSCFVVIQIHVLVLPVA